MSFVQFMKKFLIAFRSGMINNWICLLMEENICCQKGVGVVIDGGILRKSRAPTG